jgi:preprotein translocase SecE subunit
MARDVPIASPLPQPERRGRFSGTFKFIAESWAELHKVEWPTQNQLLQGTVVVLVACFIVGVFLYLNDTLWKYVVQDYLIK